MISMEWLTTTISCALSNARVSLVDSSTRISSLLSVKKVRVLLAHDPAKEHLVTVSSE